MPLAGKPVKKSFCPGVGALNKPKLHGAPIQRNHLGVESVVAHRTAILGFDFEMFFRLEDFDLPHLLTERLHQAAQNQSRLRRAA